MTFTFKLSQRLARMRPVALMLSTAALAACETPGVSVSGPQPGTQLVNVVVSPDAITLVPSQTHQFAAFGRTQAGDSVSIPVTWNATAGSISPSGLYTAVPPSGVYRVTATDSRGWLTGTATVTIADAPVASVAVSPSGANVAVGGTQQFTAMLKDANGNVLSGRTVSWNSSAPLVAPVSGTGLVTALVTGTTTVTATSEGQSGTASLMVTAPPPPPSGSWPNEPGGLTQYSDQPWDGLGSWALNDNTAGNSSLGTLSGVPFSPSGVLQYRYPQGMTGGGDAVSPGRADYFFPVGQQPTELYVGLWVKLSDPFDPHSSGVQKILYLHDNNGVVFSALWLEIYGTAQPFWVSLVNQFSGCPSIRIAPNVAQTPIRAGEWHRYEMSLKLASSGGASDGVLKVWVDGTLNVSRTDVCTLGASSGARVESVRLSGLWGGVADSKTETDYLWYDHTRVSGH